MKFEVFTRLYTEAKEYDNFEMYVAERGWQDWMDECVNADAISDTLEKIYKLGKMTLADKRKTLDLSQVKFASLYKIPARSIENWEAGAREMPPYVDALLAYTFFTRDAL